VDKMPFLLIHHSFSQIMASVDIQLWNNMCADKLISLADVTVDSAIEKRMLKETKIGWIVWDKTKRIRTITHKDTRGKDRNSVVAVLSKGTDKSNAYAQYQRAANANALILTGDVTTSDYVVGKYIGFHSRFHSYFSHEDFYDLTRPRSRTI
jgi:hypothetical protein